MPHFHVHFANRAAHTAMFVKAVSGIPFSMTAHGQDFMSDLGNDELLREICAAQNSSARKQITVAIYWRHVVRNRQQDFPRLQRARSLTLSQTGDRSSQRPIRLLSVGRLVPLRVSTH